MTFTDRIINRIMGAEIDRRVNERISAAVDQQTIADLPAPLAKRLQAASMSMDADYGWRLLSGQTTRQMLLVPYDTQVITAYWLYKTNPLAEFLINTPAAFIASDTMPYNCVNAEIKTLLSDFWERNRLELRWGNYVQELGVFGNLVLTAHVADQTGRVKLGYIDPGLLRTTIPDPEDVQTKIGVIIKATELHDERTMKVILDQDTEEDLSPAAKQLREQMTDGQCFLVQINCMSSELLGTSDLFNISEHVDSYEQMLIDSGEKYSQFNAFYYDITVDGADAKKLDEERNLYMPPRTGGAFIHNEKVKSVPVTPDLKAPDAENASRFQRRHILGSKCIPSHWYADPDSNRATAAEMDRPTLKRFSRRQNENKAVLKTIADFVVTSALDASYLTVPKEEAYQYEISTPPLSDKDVAKISTMLRDVSTSLVVAENNNWIDQKKAAQMFAFCTAMLGFEYDPDEISDVPPEGKDYQNAKFAPQEPTAPLGGPTTSTGSESAL